MWSCSWVLSLLTSIDRSEQLFWTDTWGSTSCCQLQCMLSHTVLLWAVKPFIWSNRLKAALLTWHKMRSNCFALKYSLSFIFPQRSLQRSFTSHAKLNYMLGVSNATEWTQMTTHLKKLFHIDFYDRVVDCRDRSHGVWDRFWKRASGQREGEKHCKPSKLVLAGKAV